MLTQVEAPQYQPMIAQAKDILDGVSSDVDTVAGGGAITQAALTQKLWALAKLIADLGVRLATDVAD